MTKKLISAALALIMLLGGCNSTQSPASDAAIPIEANESTPATTQESFSLTYQIPDTGITDFYSDKDMIEEPIEGEPFYGQDATYQINTPSYTDNGDGTVTDNVTGLMWQQDMGEKMTWEEAQQAAEECTLGGYDDWRVPTIKELYSLSLFTGSSSGEYAGEQQYIDTDYFIQPIGDTTKGEREIDAQTWSSTTYTGQTMNNAQTIFGVNFVDGRIKGYPLSKGKTENEMYVRLVRGNSEYGVNSFVDNGDGTVTDLATGLMWQKADSGTGMDWEESLAYAEDLELAGYNDWRLPNAKELQSIVDYSRSIAATDSAAIDPIFEITQIEDMNGKKQYPYFWSSTTHLDGNNPYSSAVYVAFGEAQGVMDGKLMDVHGAGAQRSDPKSGKAEDYPSAFGPQGDIRMVYNYVRCVRTVDIATLETQAADAPIAEPSSTKEVHFTVQADVHIDQDTDPELLMMTMENTASKAPDFIMDLGDTLMLGKYGMTEEDVQARIAVVKKYFSLLGEIPICLVNGNHDGENGFLPKLLQQSQVIRNDTYPMPFQDAESFSGNVNTANYYAFEQGDALFIALDPFTYTEDTAAGWEDTLGIEQYQWLEGVLSKSDAPIKLVFIHNLTGGIDKEHRGGIAAAKLYEWGGEEPSGQDTFSQNRPDMDMPIHDLLVKYGVTAVFHGHDHFYAREELDGIQYILVPQPGTNRPKVTTAKKKGYTTGVIFPSAGFLDVTVLNATLSVSYYKTVQNGEYLLKDAVELKPRNSAFHSLAQYQAQTA